MTRIISYVMQKLKSLSVKSKKVVQLLEILSALCVCKGVPVKQNQSKFHLLVISIFICSFSPSNTVIILRQLQTIYNEGKNDDDTQNQVL